MLRRRAAAERRRRRLLRQPRGQRPFFFVLLPLPPLPSATTYMSVYICCISTRSPGLHVAGHLMTDDTSALSAPETFRCTHTLLGLFIFLFYFTTRDQHQLGTLQAVAAQWLGGPGGVPPSPYSCACSSLPSS